MPIFASTFRWLERKKYQYEVTTPLYMMTPTEKFIFNSFLFLFFGMIIIAMTLYLPQHLNFVTHRAWFYYHGDEAKVVRSVVETATSQVVVGKVKETVASAAGVFGATREL